MMERGGKRTRRRRRGKRILDLSIEYEFCREGLERGNSELLKRYVGVGGMMGEDRLHDGVVVQVEPAEVVEEGDGEGQA